MTSQSAFMRGFIDDVWTMVDGGHRPEASQSAFMRGFIDDEEMSARAPLSLRGLNPRSCAASSMTLIVKQSAGERAQVSIRVHARLHR